MQLPFNSESELQKLSRIWMQCGYI